MIKNAAFSITVALGLAMSAPAVADFSGLFAPSTWTTNFVGDVSPPGPADNGSVDTSGAPSSITIRGGDDPSNPDGSFNSCVGGGLFGCEIQWLHTTPGVTEFSFDWAYSTVDPCGAQCDLFGVLLNGVEQILSDPGGLSSQSGEFYSGGSTIFAPIGFFVACGQDCAGGPATVVISQFAVPEPASLALLGLALAALPIRRRVKI